MKKNYIDRKWILILMFFISCNIFAQRDVDFWFAPPTISHDHTWFPAYPPLNTPVFLRITAYNHAASVTLSLPAGSIIPGSFNATYGASNPIHLAPGQTASVELTPYLSELECTPADVVLNTGLHITSDQGISVYYELANPTDGNFWPLKGKNALGTSFYIPSQTFLSNWGNITSTNTVDIVATEDNTHVTVQLNSRTGVTGHLIPGSTITETLNKGQTYSAKDTSKLPAYKLDGCTVNSDKPIAITVTDDMMNSGQTPFGGTGYWGGRLAYDAGGDQIVPLTKIGTEYIAVKGGLQTNPEKLFVLTTTDNTNFTQFSLAHPLGVSYGPYPKGTTITLNLDQTDVSNYIQSDSPIYVSQISGMFSEQGWNILPPITCNGSTSVAYVRARTNSDNGVSLLFATNGGTGTFSYKIYDNLGAPYSSGSNVLPGFPTTTATQAAFTPVPGVPSGSHWEAAKIDVSLYLPYGYSIIVTNPIPFTMGVVTGAKDSFNNTNATGLFGYFSNFGTLDIPPIASGTCPGDTLYLSADSLIDGVYSWTGPGGFTSSAQDTFIYPFTATRTGMYYLTVTSDSISCASYDSVFVGISTNCCTPPVATIYFPDTVCVGSIDSLFYSGGAWGEIIIDGHPFFGIQNTVTGSRTSTIGPLPPAAVGVHSLCYAAFSANPDSTTAYCADTVCITYVVINCCVKPVATLTINGDTTTVDTLCYGSTVIVNASGAAWGKLYGTDGHYHPYVPIPIGGIRDTTVLTGRHGLGSHHFCFVVTNDTTSNCADTVCYTLVEINCCTKPVAHLSINGDSTRVDTLCGGSPVILQIAGGVWGHLIIDGKPVKDNPTDTNWYFPVDSFIAHFDPSGGFNIGTIDDSLIGTVYTICYVAATADPDSTDAYCADTVCVTIVVVDCGTCRSIYGTSHLVVHNQGNMQYQMHDSFTSIPPNFINWIVDGVTVGRTVGTDPFVYQFGPGYHSICMQTGTFLPDSNGDNICCYNTICDSINIDACAYWKSTDSISFALDSANVDSVTFTFHGSTSPIWPTLVWNFGDGTTLVSSTLTVGHLFPNRKDDRYNVCVDVIWSRVDSITYDSLSVCCCVDTICLTVVTSPCAIPIFYIGIVDSASGSYVFQVLHTTSYGSVNITNWTVDSFPEPTGPFLNYAPAIGGTYIVCADFMYTVLYDGMEIPCNNSVCQSFNLSGAPGVKAKFSVYPNPTTNGQIIVQVTNNSDATSARVEIADMTGQPIMAKSINGLGKGITQNYMDIGNLPQGIYTIKMTIGGVQQIDKLVRE